MGKTRKKYSADFKLKAVMEVLKKEKTAAQLAGELEVHPLVLSGWKKHFMKAGSQIFEKPRKASKIQKNQINVGNSHFLVAKIKR